MPAGASQVPVPPSHAGPHGRFRPGDDLSDATKLYVGNLASTSVDVPGRLHACLLWSSCHGGTRLHVGCLAST